MVTLSLRTRPEKEENPLFCLKWQRVDRREKPDFQATSPKSLPGKVSKHKGKVPVPENRHRWPRRVA